MLTLLSLRKARWPFELQSDSSNVVLVHARSHMAANGTSFLRVWQIPTEGHSVAEKQDVGENLRREPKLRSFLSWNTFRNASQFTPIQGADPEARAATFLTAGML